MIGIVKIKGALLKISTLFLTLVFASLISQSAYADRPDRCFHKHYNNKSTCKAGIRGKKCTDAKGNKGKCVQNSTKCYCKIHTKKTKQLLDLGLDVGVTIMKNKKHKKHHKHPH